MAGDRVRLEVLPREAGGSAEARRVRARGLVPGVIYGNGSQAQAFAVEERELRRVLTGDHGLHTILDVVVGGGGRGRPAVVKEYQRDPVRERLVHIDLQEVRLDRPIQSQVALELVGDAEGVTAGGVLTQAAREVTVEALPMDIPDHISIDVSHLGIGDSVHVSDVSVPANVTVLDDPETVVASVTQPTRVEVPEEMAEDEEAAAAEGVETPPEQQPESAASEPSEPGGDAAGSPGTVSG